MSPVLQDPFSRPFRVGYMTRAEVLDFIARYKRRHRRAMTRNIRAELQAAVNSGNKEGLDALCKQEMEMEKV
jgi:hypothetical protein